MIIVVLMMAKMKYVLTMLVQGKDDPLASYVPFHKLAQWLTYSLLDPLESFGIKFMDKWLLTGLAEYRNGGLLIDAGVLKTLDPGALQREYKVCCFDRFHC